MSKKVVVLLAEGFEDVEAVTPADYLRRAGAEVVVAAVKSRETKSSRGLTVLADTTVADLKAEGLLRAASWDAVLLPGGMPGAANIASSASCEAFIKEMAAAGRVVAAICAAPAVALYPMGVIAGRRFTCYPGMESEVSGARWSEERVVVDGNVVTSRGPGTAGEWAIALAGILCGEDAARKVAKATLLHP